MRPSASIVRNVNTDVSSVVEVERPSTRAPAAGSRLLRHSPLAVSLLVHGLALIVLSLIAFEISLPAQTVSISVLDLDSGVGDGPLELEFGNVSAGTMGLPQTDDGSAPGPIVMNLPLGGLALDGVDGDAATGSFEGAGFGSGMGVPGDGGGVEGLEGIGGGGGILGTPRNAVRKGRFAAFTLPIVDAGGEEASPGDPPAEGQDYFIVIQVKLPGTAKTYGLSDLSGYVQGTDGYTQTIPGEAFLRNADEEVVPIGRKRQIPVVNGTVQILIRVPGARAEVRDTIQIASARLREKQKLQLTFESLSSSE